MGQRPQGQRALSLYTFALRLAILLVLCGVQVTCVPLPPPAPLQVTLDQVQGIVGVVRQGQPLAVSPPMPLASGDVIETTGNAFAMVRFPEGHEVHLLPDTRLQISSIFVFFGEIFVRARGFFRVENAFVALEVESTEFSCRVERDQTVSMSVATGRVRLVSKTGRWRPIRVGPGEGYTVPRNEVPIRETGGRPPPPLPPRPPRPPSPPDQGWCCVDGQLSRDDPSDCRRRGGRSFDSEEQARRVCRDRETEGWCCVDGQLSRDDPSDCRRRGGRSFDSEEQARRVCRDRETEGWCCVDGQLSRDDPSDCRRRGGRSFDSEEQARRVCRGPGGQEGWCCNQNGRVFETNETQCRREGGRLYRSPREAQNDRRCRIR